MREELTATREQRRMRDANAEALNARILRWQKLNPELSIAEVARFFGVSPTRVQRAMGKR